MKKGRSLKLIALILVLVMAVSLPTGIVLANKQTDEAAVSQVAQLQEETEEGDTLAASEVGDDALEKQPDQTAPEADVSKEKPVEEPVDSTDEKQLDVSADTPNHEANGTESKIEEDEELEVFADAGGRVYLHAYLVNSSGEAIHSDGSVIPGDTKEEILQEKHLIDSRLNDDGVYSKGDTVRVDPKDVLEHLPNDSFQYQYYPNANEADPAGEHTFPYEDEDYHLNIGYMRRINVTFKAYLPGKNTADILGDIPDGKAAYTGDTIVLSDYPTIPKGIELKGWTTQEHGDVIEYEPDDEMVLEETHKVLYAIYDTNYAQVTYKYFLAAYSGTDTNQSDSVYAIDWKGNVADGSSPETWTILGEKKHTITEGDQEFYAAYPEVEQEFTQYEPLFTKEMEGRERTFRAHDTARYMYFDPDIDALHKRGDIYLVNDKITPDAKEEVEIYIPYRAEYFIPTYTNYPTDATNDGEELVDKMVHEHNAQAYNLLEDQGEDFALQHAYFSLSKYGEPNNYTFIGFYWNEDVGVVSLDDIDDMHNDPDFYPYTPGNSYSPTGFRTLIKNHKTKAFSTDNKIYAVWTDAVRVDPYKISAYAYWVSLEGKAKASDGTDMEPQPELPLTIDSDLQFLDEGGLPPINLSASNSLNGSAVTSDLKMVAGVKYKIFPRSRYNKVHAAGTKTEYLYTKQSEEYGGASSGLIEVYFDEQSNMYDAKTDEKIELFYGYRAPRSFIYHTNYPQEQDEVFVEETTFPMISASRPFAPNVDSPFKADKYKGKTISYWSRSPEPSPVGVPNSQLPAEQKRFYVNTFINSKSAYEASNVALLDNAGSRRDITVGSGWGYYDILYAWSNEENHLYAHWEDERAYFNAYSILANEKGDPIGADGRVLEPGQAFEQNKIVINPEDYTVLEVPYERMSTFKVTGFGSSYASLTDAAQRKYSLATERKANYNPWSYADGTRMVKIFPEHMSTKTDPDNGEVVYLGYKTNTTVKAHANYPAGVGKPDVSQETTHTAGSKLSSTSSLFSGIEKPDGYKLIGWSLKDSDEIIVPDQAAGTYGYPIPVDGIELYAQWVEKGINRNNGKITIHSRLTDADGKPLKSDGQPASSIKDVDVTKIREPYDLKNIFNKSDLNSYYFAYYPRAYNFTQGDVRYKFEEKSVQYDGHRFEGPVLLTPETNEQDIYFGYSAHTAHALLYDVNLPGDATLDTAEVEGMLEYENNQFYEGEEINEELATFPRELTTEYGSTKLNYVFLGWTEDKAGEGILYTKGGINDYIMPDGPSTLYAQWKPRYVNAIFRVQKGGYIEGDTGWGVIQTVPHGTLFKDLDFPEVTVDPGYEFIGWNDSYKPDTPLYEDSYIMAMVQPIQTIYNITVTAEEGGSLEGGTPDVVIPIEEGELWKDEKLPKPIADEGYYFAGWEGKPEDGAQINSDGNITATFKKQTSLTVKVASAEKVYDGKALTKNSYTITDGALEGGDVLELAIAGSAKNVADTAAGNNTIASYKVWREGEDVTHTYNIKALPGTLTITERPLTITVHPAQKLQGESDPVFTGKVEGFAYREYEQNIIRVTYKRADEHADREQAGDDIDIVAEYTLRDEISNYVVDTVNNNKLTIHNPAEIQVTFRPGQNGSLNGAKNDIVYDVAPGTPFSKLSVPTETPDAGYYFAGWHPELPEGSSTVDEPAIYTAQFVKQTELTVQAGSAMKTYDGGTLRSNAFSITKGALKSDSDGKWEDIAKVTMTGGSQITYAGRVDNVIENVEILRTNTLDPLGLNQTDVTHEYSVQTLKGVLEVRAVSVTLTAKNQSKDFDGKAYAAEAMGELAGAYYTLSGNLRTGDAVSEISVSSPAKNVNDSNNEIAIGSYKISRGGRDVTAEYHVTLATGALNIKPLAVTMQANSYTKTEGEHDPAFAYKNKSELDGYAAMNGSGLSIYSPKLDTANETQQGKNRVIPLVVDYRNTNGNFAVTEKNGTLTIKPKTPPVDPTKPPVDPTDPPVDPTDPPVTPTNPPVMPTNPPVTPTNPPVTPTNPPVVAPTPTPTPGGGGVIDPTDPTDPTDPDTPGGGTVVDPDDPSTPDIVDGGQAGGAVTDDGALNEPVTREQYQLRNDQTLQSMKADNAPMLRFGDTEIPLSGIGYEAVWSLLNLLLMIAGLVLAVVLLITFFIGRREEEAAEGTQVVSRGARQEEEELARQKKSILWRILVGVLAVAQIIAFVLTQDMNNLMVLVDKWTVLMVILFGVEILFTIFAGIKRRPKEDDEDAMETSSMGDIPSVR